MYLRWWNECYHTAIEWLTSFLDECMTIRATGKYKRSETYQMHQIILMIQRSMNAQQAFTPTWDLQATFEVELWPCCWWCLNSCCAGHWCLTIALWQVSMGVEWWLLWIDIEGEMEELNWKKIMTWLKTFQPPHIGGCTNENGHGNPKTDSPHSRGPNWPPSHTTTCAGGRILWMQNWAFGWTFEFLY